MSTKTITIMEDVYKKLVSLKASGESFSDELRRLTRMKSNIMGLAGSWRELRDEDIKKMKSTIKKLRRGSRLERINLEK